ncbi:MAG: hypothetical protein EBQ99_11020, partial [Planctomycetes bacterium]|nr:hypothetical protein [Planctomycetota bacterium]
MPSRVEPTRVLHISTWGVPCGIATYAGNLVAALERLGVAGDVFPLDPHAWQHYLPGDVERLRGHIVERARAFDVVHVQHEHGLFGLAKGARGSARNYGRILGDLLAAGKPVVTTFHTAPLGGRRRRGIAGLLEKVRGFSRARTWYRRVAAPHARARGRALALVHASHTRHHRYTLHPPDDLEVVLPIRLMVRHFLLTGFLDPVRAWKTFLTHVRIARGKFEGEWELTLYPPEDGDSRSAPVRWSRTVLAGHGLIALAAVATGQWIVLPLVTFAPFYGSWLFFLCNNTQHIGLQDFVPDFRLCCRTFTLSPFVRFLYWNMNYHTEHHMYAAVPSYNLARLHEAIRHDLPPTPHGLVAVWKQIAEI